jgi:tRNA pseudouridine-54 N-methylase
MVLLFVLLETVWGESFLLMISLKMGMMLENSNKGFWKKALKSNLEGFFWAEFNPGTTRRRKARQAVIAATLRIGFLTIAASFKGLLAREVIEENSDLIFRD